MCDLVWGGAGNRNQDEERQGAARDAHLRILHARGQHHRGLRRRHHQGPPCLRLTLCGPTILRNCVVTFDGASRSPLFTLFCLTNSFQFVCLPNLLSTILLFYRLKRWGAILCSSTTDEPWRKARRSALTRSRRLPTRSWLISSQTKP